MRTFLFALALMSSAACAQTGDATRGNTPPGMSTDGSRPADGAIKGGSTIAPGEKAGIPEQAPTASKPERVARCNELTGLLRDQCLDKERSAAGGSSAPAPRPRNKEAPKKEAPVTDDEDLQQKRSVD